MITFQQARQKVLNYLRALEEDGDKVIAFRKDAHAKDPVPPGVDVAEITRLGICEDLTITGDFGWVFYYQTQDFIDSQDNAKALQGNAPLIVSLEDGRLYETGIEEPIEVYIENFRRTGDPRG